jgi:hypothetical protein
MRIYEIECKLKHSGLYDFIIPSSRGSVGRLVDCLFRSGSFVWKINGFIQRIKCNHYPTLTGHGIFADDVIADFWTASALVNLAESCTYIRVYYAFRVCVFHARIHAVVHAEQRLSALRCSHELNSPGLWQLHSRTTCDTCAGGGFCVVIVRFFSLAGPTLVT